MKKIIAAIIALVVVFAVALCVESSFSKEKRLYVNSWGKKTQKNEKK